MVLFWALVEKKTDVILRSGVEWAFSSGDSSPSLRSGSE